ncbi:homocysteine S-methyltransferase family protein [uncultured Shewanella sp.]|uniref:homocysteine S-methyltransferase family protein n=1 Tax=uncultured Shewanella sp. TaxID=173975 RepID=UPI0026203214|nr:homocysteine S-methyltransferase family protein [uncultured Shewanella sp.]
MYNKTFNILDGGMGRELKRIGAPFQQPQWSAQALIEDHTYVTQVHDSFIQAGSEIITINSYACVPFHLGDSLFEQQGAKLIQQAATLARSSANKYTGTQVAACIPPLFGSYRPDLFDAQKANRILTPLIDNQAPFADFWLIETISSIEELQLVMQALAKSNKPKWLAFSLSDDANIKPQLRSGEPLENAIQVAIDYHADAILFNCCIPEVILNAIERTQALLQAADKQTINIGAYANAFQPINTTHVANEAQQPMRDLTPNDYLAFVKQWLSAGASIIGGCCGVTPEHIATIKQFKDTL